METRRRFPSTKRCRLTRSRPTLGQAGQRALHGSFYRCYGLETVCLRYFNIFGPRQDPSSAYSGVLAKFSMQMLRGEQPTIFGDGETSRDFTYIDNAVSANLLACSPRRECAGRVLNCATGRRITLNETFAALKPLTGYEGAVKYGPERGGDIKHSLADITQAQKPLGYKVLVNFEDGLRRTVEWYKSCQLSTVSRQ